MRVTIDRAGRIVIPKEARRRLGLEPGTELELDVVDDVVLELSVPSVPKRLVERDGDWVIEAEAPVPEVTAEQVRETLERLRR